MHVNTQPQRGEINSATHVSESRPSRAYDRTLAPFLGLRFAPPQAKSISPLPGL